MIAKRSRYAGAEAFVSTPDRTTRFGGIRPRRITRATGVIEHEVKAGDRLDHLAQHYYNNDRLWWRIVDANPEFFYGQSYGTPERAPGSPGTEVPAPGILLLEHLEGSVILIPRLSER